MFEYLEQNLNLNFRAKREEKFCLNTWSQTRIRPGFEAESHEQEQSQEPDAHQAKIRGQETGARAKPRARRASGQHSELGTTSKEADAHQARNRGPKPGAKSQTRFRPGSEASGHELRQAEADAEAEAEAAGGRSDRSERVRARARTPIKSNT